MVTYDQARIALEVMQLGDFNTDTTILQNKALAVLTTYITQDMSTEKTK